MPTERKLATIREIAEIKPIDGADKICAYRVDGWWVIDQVGKYNVGDLVVYCEVDSWLPTELAPFLSKGKEPREFEGVKGERLRTIRLKGQVSQGLLLPVEIDNSQFCGEVYLVNGTAIEVGDDVTDALGILKYEKPIPAQLVGLIRGNFPSEIPKTNQERVQNLTQEFESLKKRTWTITEKLDGTSCTFYLDKDGEFHVCSRNLDLKRDENNLYWKTAIELGIEQTLRDRSDFGVALQGEIIGEGIQGSQYKYKPHFRLFDVYNVNESNYINPTYLAFIALGLGVQHVPILHTGWDISGFNIEGILNAADGVSKLNDSIREGLVFQCEQDPSLSFKSVSNKWLLKYE